MRDLAKLLGKSAGYISRIEVRGDVPSADLICKIADIHTVSPKGLLDLAKQTQLERLTLELDERYSEALRNYEGSGEGKGESR